MRRTLVFMLVGVALILSPAWLSAQTTTGSIEGQVVDAQGLPLPGATVTYTSRQGSKRAITDGGGRYRLQFLTPETYDISVGFPGFNRIVQKGVAVRLGQTTAVNFKMQVGGVSEVVQVTAETPVIDASTPSIGASIDVATLANIPMGRNVSDTLYLAPGVTSSGSGGRANPSIAGGTALDNQYIIDGVNVTNAGFGGLGSYSIIFGSLGTATPYDFVKEVQVKTGGYEAEFGQATGGLVNMITKSGGNDLRGSLFTYLRPHSLERGWTTYESTNGSVNTVGTHLFDGGAEVGGPIVKNRLFFFGAVDPSFEQRLLVAPPDFPLASLGEVARDRQIVNYAGKATMQFSTNHRLDASFFGDPAVGASGPQRTSSMLASDTSQFSKLDKYGGHNQTLSYSGAISGHLLLEASLSHAGNQVMETPSVDAWRVQDQTVSPTLNSGGIGFFEQGNDSRNTQYQAKATQFFGGHELKYGFLAQDIAYSRLFNRTGPAFTLPDGTLSATGAEIVVQPDPEYGQIYRVRRANLIDSEATTQTYAAFFVQDTWRLGNLTIQPGLRYEQQKLTGTLESLTLNNNWAPRIGATYDPTGSGHAKIFGNWGRYFAQVPNDLAARSLSTDSTVSRADYFDAALTQPVPDGLEALGVTSHYILSATSSDLIDPNVKSSYVDEAVAGFDYDLKHTNLGVHYTHRSIPRVLEDVGPYAVGACDLLGVGCNFDYTLTNPGPDTAVIDPLGATYEKPIHIYDAITFMANQHFSDRWSLQSSYTWSRLFGTFEGFYRDDNGQSDPGITSLYDFPTNDPSYTALGVPLKGYEGDIRFLGDLGKGPLPLDRPHQVKIYGNYSFPDGLNFGGGLTMNSGRPLTALAANPNYTNGGEIPLTPRGEGFQTVDGFRTRTPFEYYPDLHVDYRVRHSGNRQVVLLADAFNFLNLQRTTGYDNWSELSFGVPNPDFGKPVTQVLGGAPPQIQAPLQVRVGVKYQF